MHIILAALLMLPIDVLPPPKLDGALNTTLPVAGRQLLVYDLYPGVLPVEGDQRIYLRSGKTLRPVNNLGELKGDVSITSPRQALDFVRLRTSASTYTMWRGDETVEIMSIAQMKAAATYGWPSVPMYVGEPGWLGIISARDMAHGGLSSAVVVTTPHAFHVKRWLLISTFDGKTSNLILEKVDETVSTNGAYTCKVLAMKPAKSVHVHWQFMTFM